MESQIFKHVHTESAENLSWARPLKLASHSACKAGNLHPYSTDHLMGWGRRQPIVPNLCGQFCIDALCPTSSGRADSRIKLLIVSMIVHEPQHLLVGETCSTVVQRDEKRQRFCSAITCCFATPPLVRQLRGESFGAIRFQGQPSKLRWIGLSFSGIGP